MKARYWIALAIILAVVAVLGMRHNNITAHDMQAEIIARDMEGEEVEEQLRELEYFTHNRMNATAPGRMEVFLQGSYEQAVADAEAAADQAVGGEVYQQAQSACEEEGRDPRDVAECAQDFISERLGDEQPEADIPEEADYTYTFISPRWSPDIAGLPIAGAILSLVIAAVVYVRGIVLRFR